MYVWDVPYKDPERRRQYAKDWIRNNPEKAREAMQRWRERHPDAHRAEVRAYYRRTDAKKIQLAAYRLAHPDVRRVAHQRRRARELNAPGHFTTKEWLDLVAAYDGRCAYCGEVGPLHAEHRTPLFRGGSNDIANILPACPSCNLKKSTSTEREFRVRVLNERLRSSEFEVVDWWAAGEIQSVS